MGQPKPPWQILLSWGGAVAILLLVFLPSTWGVWCHASRVAATWGSIYFLMPATYVYAWSALWAMLFPAGVAFKCTPLARAEDATPRVVLGLNGFYFALALGGALVWQAIAWISYPLLRDGGLRIRPLWPWPDWPFFSQFLCF